jgi:hypothetical protein
MDVLDGRVVGLMILTFHRYPTYLLSNERPKGTRTCLGIPPRPDNVEEAPRVTSSHSVLVYIRLESFVIPCPLLTRKESARGEVFD